MNPTHADQNLLDLQQGFQHVEEHTNATHYPMVAGDVLLHDADQHVTQHVRRRESMARLALAGCSCTVPQGFDWWCCSGIERCYIVEADATGPTKVQTDGINFSGVWAHTDLIDVDNITTNDVGSTLRMYGVEAARATLMREVRAVFGAYGIGVDPRHLGLIADFMTHMVSLRSCLVHLRRSHHARGAGIDPWPYCM